MRTGYLVKDVVVMVQAERTVIQGIQGMQGLPKKRVQVLPKSAGKVIPTSVV
jgi:hypothetical protein